MADTTKTLNRKLSLDKVRNIGIIAHIDAGKTTTTERILYYTGRTYKIGDIDEGNTTMDWMAQERERGITIVSAATTTFWKDYRINLIDTPGHVDFTAEVERSLRVLDGAVTILDAEETVQSQTETVWRQADKYNVPRIIFVNKIDKLGANFYKTVEAVKTRLGVKPAIMVLPIGVENTFRGVYDLLNEEAIIWGGDELGAKFEIKKEIPPELSADDVKKYRDLLVEVISETDDELMAKYLEGTVPSKEELKIALRKAVINYLLVPMYTGTSLRNKGVQPLLDAIIDYLPSPLDRGVVHGTNPKTGSLEERKSDNAEHFCGLAFKIQLDPHVGKLYYVRIYSGTLKAGSYLFNISKGQTERISRLLLMHANQREEVEEAYAGEIVAVVGLKDTRTGDTLCDPDHPILLEGITFPEPVISLAIEPKTKSDQERLSYALQRVMEEDPTIKVKSNQETGQTIISGVGE
ncbi:MAG: translation factor GTPase family protein, partial [Patescibacteria group bacterium]